MSNLQAPDADTHAAAAAPASSITGISTRRQTAEIKLYLPDECASGPGGPAGPAAVTVPRRSDAVAARPPSPAPSPPVFGSESLQGVENTRTARQNATANFFFFNVDTELISCADALR